MPGHESLTLRNVLIVSYYFPPAGEVGVHRILRFLRNLPEFGWRGIVLTAGNAKVQQFEPALVEKVPADVIVHRSSSFESLNYGQSLNNQAPTPRSSSHFLRLAELPKDLWRYLAIPDDKIGWVPSAVRAGARLIKEHDIQAILVSGKPFSSYIIGHRLHRSLGIPWLMDVRDLWHLNRRSRPKSRLHSLINGWLERQLVHSASFVIANTPGNRQDFIKNYSECCPDKFVTITNGYDRLDFSGTGARKFEKFTISFIGSFYFQPEVRSSLYRRCLGIRQRPNELFETHSPRFLFEALTSIFQDQPELRKTIEMVIAGPGKEKVETLIERAGLGDNVRHLGWIPHSASLELIRRSHAACLTLARGEESAGWIPSKLFPYMASGTPVLALVPEGDAARIVRETACGFVVAPDNVDQIKSALLQLHESAWQCDPCCKSDRSRIECYEGRALTARLADCLDSVVARGEPGDSWTPQNERPEAEASRSCCS